MKKLLQLTIMLLLSYTVYSQNREALPVFNEGFENQNPQLKHLITDDFYGINAYSHETSIFNLHRDNDFLMDQSYFYWWSDVYDMYECYRRYFYTYDANHNLIERLEQWMDGSGPIEKRIYDYDVNNNMVEENIYDYDGDEWILSKRIFYTYGALNNLIYEVSKVWDGSGFQDETRTNYVYDDNNNRSYFIEERWDNDDQIWVNSFKWIDYFDENNNRYKIITKNWDVETSMWINGTQAFYTYDEETNNLLMISGQNWDEETSDWGERVQRNRYAYDANNNRTIMEIDELNDPDSEWHNIMLQAYFYVPVGSEQHTHNRSNLNKSIEDMQTTEDELVISGKQASENRSLYCVEVLIDSVLHTSVGDLEFTLSHKGVTETIIYQAGGDGDNFINTKLTDRGFDTISNGMAPFSGVYKAENPLSAFAGVNPEGTWTLRIYDGVSGNTGTLIAWGLNFIYAENSGVEDEFSEDLTFKLFPNPAVSVVSLQSAVFSLQSAILEIYDLNGKKLLEKHIPSGTETVEIDVSSLQNGVYCCKVSTDKYSATKKLIIQK